MLILCDWAQSRYSVVGHCRDTLRLGTAGILWQLGTAGILCVRWALLGYCVIGHCKDILRLGTACWDTLRWGTARTLCGGHGKDTLRLVTAGYSAVGHCRDTWRLGTAIFWLVLYLCLISRLNPYIPAVSIVFFFDPAL